MSIRNGASVKFALREPICIYSREVLNQLLLDRAESNGVKLVRERITAVERDGSDWTLRGTSSQHETNFLVLAAGARNPFTEFALPQSKDDTSMTLGYFIPGSRNVMEIEFQPGLEGYLWIFPRDTHSSVGICGTLLRETSQQMKVRLHDYMSRKGIPMEGARFYSHRLPALQRESFRKLKVAGEGWAAIGDAAGLVDPITGEGLYYALRSAEVFAACYIKGDAAAYAREIRNDFLHDLELAARIAPRFYHGKFLGGAVTTRMIQFAARSATFAALIQDLFAGNQGYLGLKQRLLNNPNRTLGEIAASFFAFSKK